MPASRTPPLRRRLAALVYEAVLLFGVLMAAGFAVSTLADQRHALEGRRLLQAVLFLVLGAYFVGFWRRGGQTLALQTWRIRLVRPDGRPAGWRRSLLRYLLAWVWVLPAWGGQAWLGLEGGGAAAGLLAGWMLLYALSSRLLPDRQFAHDLLAGTRLVDLRPIP